MINTEYTLANFRNDIKQELKFQGWDYNYLARSANLNQDRVRRIIGGSTKPTEHEIQRICKILGMN